MPNFKPNPDFERLRKVLMRDGEPDRVPFFELYADRPVMDYIMGKPIDTIDGLIEYQYKMGYDYVSLNPGNMNFPTGGRGFVTGDKTDKMAMNRQFNVAHMGVIHSWEDFEKYPWPSKDKIDYSNITETAKKLPDGMKMIVCGGHQLELMMALMGYEDLSYALIDQPDLVKAVSEKIGEVFEEEFAVVATMDKVGAVLISDDLGFKTATLISPESLREYVFPWYKKFTKVPNEKKVPVILHSCGELKEVYQDIIDSGINAKHSYEDQILPVSEFKQKYGNNLAALGGLDVDFMCRSSEEEVRSKTRETLEKCMPGGGYALGTGNSVTNYIPVENFLAMVDEGRKSGKYK